MSSRKVREKLRERRMAFDRAVAESRKHKEVKPEEKAEKKTKPRKSTKKTTKKKGEKK